MGSTEKKALVLFARDPALGQVKTRLQPLLGAETALALYTCFLRDSIDKISAVAGAELFVGVYPSASSAFFANLSTGKAVGIFTQEGSDLGARMQNAFLKFLGEGFAKVVIIGSDSPTLPVSYIEAAFASAKDVAVGPSYDGGYYLVGMNGKLTKIFSGVEWGTDRVLAQTLERLRFAGAGLELLPLWYDVDRPEDLRFLQIHLALLRQGRMAVPPATDKYLEGMDLGQI